jgi:hypothetical protein
VQLKIAKQIRSDFQTWAVQFKNEINAQAPRTECRNQIPRTRSTERGLIGLRAAFDFHKERQAKTGCCFDFLRK